MKAQLEAFVYYPVYAVKVVHTVVTSYIGGFIKGLKNGSK